ncbi:TnsA endonuclease N-terminal domain-containing protein [Bacillus sp. FJAT-49705]|uniref:TnsA endonuclease N-terminal domain-containing protein n=1 Tax=Cytobacillus citreus TaxID=2833586 RepID=A0ABS5NQC5_9BACI|nr:TnsA endonuclease N-terminal domain-containing protein [Cytobacillus citreus]MBS4189771.1 TnsA endonuclease N-terminal domain-containing protein [Cytobacillus citreus]
MKEGRGQGELSNYKPWINIQDFGSSGRVHRLNVWKTNRIHHLLSDLERNYFYALEWADEVIDIQDQYPLDRHLSTVIAEEKAADQVTETPLVMTTDFLITVRKNKEIIKEASN